LIPDKSLEDSDGGSGGAALGGGKLNVVPGTDLGTKEHLIIETSKKYFYVYFTSLKDKTFLEALKLMIQSRCRVCYLFYN